MEEPSEGYVRVSGFKIYYRSFGRPEGGTVLALAGGPLSVHNYLLPMADLVQFGYRVVLFDQLGCGKSDRPKGAKYFTERRAVDDVEGIRRALRLGKVHLFGNSYGGALALDVALKYPKSLRSLVISSGFASWALAEAEGNRLASGMPKAIQDTITKYEAKGDLKNPKYLAAVDAYLQKHGCRLRVRPYDLWYMKECRRNEEFDSEPIDRLKGWDVTDRLPEIKLPCLITVGKYDGVTPKCARAIHRGIRGSKLVIFGESAHHAIWEERERFIEVVKDFLDDVKV